MLRTIALLVPMVTLPVLATDAALAQPAAKTTATGDRGKSLGLALGGYCPVCLANGKGWVVGAAEFQAVFDGSVYRFPSTEMLAAFQSEPAKYVPALGGDDLVEYARTGQRVAGKLAYGATYLDRRYFFSSEANKQAFQSYPTHFADADLAGGGTCLVCRVDLGREIAGDPRFESLHNGVRYRFAGPQQQEAFEAHPGRYAVPPAPVSGPGTR